MKLLRNIFKLNTIDLDDQDRETVTSFVEKCPYLISMEVVPSPGGRGWHFTLWCSRSCELCRELYDDPVRYAKDRMRPSYTRNILFTKKYITPTSEETEDSTTKETEDLNTTPSIPYDQRDEKMVKLKVRTTITEVEEGIHEATLSTIEKIETSVGPALRWTFTLSDGTEVTGITSTRTSPASKLVRWYTALGGKVENNEIDTDKVTGRTCQVRVVHRAGKFGGAKFANVADVLPLPIKK